MCTELDAAGLRMPIGAGVAGAVVSSGELVSIADAYHDPRFDRSADNETGFVTRTILAVPVLKPASLSKQAGEAAKVGCVIEASPLISTDLH